VFVGEIRPSRDRQFKQFRSMAYGYRAMFRILDNYVRRYRLDTVEKIIARWAPENENDTKAYISTVCRLSGLTEESRVDPDSMETMCGIVCAMSYVENGRAAVRADVEAGWRLLKGGDL
ncbi:MAG: structural protein P5, partial [Parabacteroides sp.]